MSKRRSLVVGVTLGIVAACVPSPAAAPPLAPAAATATVTSPSPARSDSTMIVLDAGARIAMSPGRRASALFSQLAATLLNDPMFQSMHWGILVVDPLRGDTLYARNADKLFVPASNTKLVTAAVALERLGADFRYTTRLFGRPPSQGVIRGDLLVVGDGDPSFSDSLSGSAMAPMLALADSLRAQGVRRITGRLASGANTFPGDTLGLGWAWDDLDDGYAAPVDELLFNEGMARVIVRGGARPGDPVQVQTAPSTVQPRIGRVDVVTERACCMLRSRVEARYDMRGPRPQLLLSGSVRAGDSVAVNVALRNGNSAFLEAFAEALRSRGIVVAGGIAADTVLDTLGLSLLATRTSPPLAAMLPAFQKPSQNQIGEVLLRTLGQRIAGVGTADSGRAVVKRQLEAWGIDSSQAALVDGSGLSRRNFISPRALVKILETMRTHPSFDAWYQALPVAGVDGTIRERMRGSLAAGNARAKTGTLDRVRALSGYVTTADGQILLFSMLANNHSVPTREIERVQDALVSALASQRLVDP